MTCSKLRLARAGALKFPLSGTKTGAGLAKPILADGVCPGRRLPRAMLLSHSCAPKPQPKTRVRPLLTLSFVALTTFGAGCSFRHQVVHLPPCGSDATPTAHHVLELRPLVQQSPQPHPPQQDSACPSGRCNAGEPQVALAVARPALCNDYPVTYRVIQPDTVARVRLVDQLSFTPPPP